MIREKLYEVEKLRREAFLNDNWSKKEEAINLMFLEIFQSIAPSESGMLDYINEVNISKEIIGKVSRCNMLNTSENIDDKKDFCTSFVENELNVNLEKVKILRIEGDYSNFEGFAVSCCDKEHLVILPKEDETVFNSSDLLIHELAHTAEYTLRRQNSNSDECLFPHSILSETIAHYCQFKYLIDYGNKEQRIGVIGSITKGYIDLKAISASSSLDETKINITNIINHRALKDFVHVYGESQVKEILACYENLEIGPIYHDIVEPRFGSLIALKLIDQPEVIRELCTVSSSNSVSEIFTNMDINPSDLLDFSQADKLLENFING